MNHYAKITLIWLFVIGFLCLFIFRLSAFAHGYPTAEEFQMFSGSVLAQPVATIGGVAVAIPFAIIGTVGGLIISPFTGNDVKENCMAGSIFIGMCGYMVGQQIGWPVYGIEKGIGWCFK